MMIFGGLASFSLCCGAVGVCGFGPPFDSDRSGRALLVLVMASWFRVRCSGNHHDFLFTLPTQQLHILDSGVEPHLCSGPTVLVPASATTATRPQLRYSIHNLQRLIP
ncbi:hypothetical protein B0J13DRAFT_548036 [Dactylonectria estremocensis]|uniref:Secreted protein n=1 Tax=Dactylonectria estremocensis TaxID=1079267 RepID=A0A9P9F4S0_9HYPO|nr:hypothetical protein B0J13DRAFT_548036 [Dactylonectria estremocensis]